jgi:hypothetical protein
MFNYNSMLINIIQKFKTDQSYNSEEGGSWYLPIHQPDNVPIIDNIPPAFALLKFLSINEGILKKNGFIQTIPNSSE